MTVGPTLVALDSPLGSRDHAAQCRTTRERKFGTARARAEPTRERRDDHPKCVIGTPRARGVSSEVFVSRRCPGSSEKASPNPWPNTQRTFSSRISLSLSLSCGAQALRHGQPGGVLHAVVQPVAPRGARRRSRAASFPSCLFFLLFFSFFFFFFFSGARRRTGAGAGTTAAGCLADMVELSFCL